MYKHHRFGGKSSANKLKCKEESKVWHTSEILEIQFQTMTIKQVE